MGVEVQTNRGNFAAERLIITAGPWAAEVLAELRLPLQVLRKHVYWFGNNSEQTRQEAGCPTYLFELPAGVFYGFPQCDPVGVKMGEHTSREKDVVTDVLGDSRALDATDLARVSAFREQCLPGVSATVNRRSVCYYTMTPDGHFLVDHYPQHPNIAFAAGLSGHGFKFVGVLGEALADLVTAGKTSLPIGFLGLAERKGVVHVGE
jgi:glycine/D-amino acid oxidase-like deaminating enzyme